MSGAGYILNATEPEGHLQLGASEDLGAHPPLVVVEVMAAPVDLRGRYLGAQLSTNL